MNIVDLNSQSVRDLNQALHDVNAATADAERYEWLIENPKGLHNIACGLDADLNVTINGHVGYFCAGMNQLANIKVVGNVGQGVAENMMSGQVRVTGDASQSAGATAHGGLLVIEGNAAARCGISMKGVDIVVGGNVGHMSSFMGQAGTLVVCGDAGEALGDSLYEVDIFVRGEVKSLGADCIEKPMTDELQSKLSDLLEKAAFDYQTSEFRYYGSARQLYNFKVDNASVY